MSAVQKVDKSASQYVKENSLISLYRAEPFIYVLYVNYIYV